MKITAVSDLHGFYPKLPGGDLLIVAGDLTARDTKCEYTTFTNWYQSQDYKKKILVAGNHDCCIEKGDYYFNQDWLGYLQDSGTEFEGFKIWGSPWTLEFEGMNPLCKAFTVKTEEELNEKWDLIPNDVDILITHSPAYDLLDWVPNWYDGTIFHAGSTSLRDKIHELKNLKLHVFGHIHEAYGIRDFETHTLINASHVNRQYKPVNTPQSIKLEKHERINCIR